MTGDTAPCEMSALAAHQAELLVHDSSFADQETERAAETGHSTARQAAELARDARVGMLALVHISSRYDVREVLAEARGEFAATEAPRDFDLVEVPLPERGGPRLIENGARAAPGLSPERRAASQPSGAARSATACATAIGWSSWRKCLASSRIGSSTPSASSAARIWSMPIAGSRLPQTIRAG